MAIEKESSFAMTRKNKISSISSQPEYQLFSTATNNRSLSKSRKLRVQLTDRKKKMGNLLRSEDMKSVSK